MDRNLSTLPRQVTRRAGRPQENGWCMQVASLLANADFEQVSVGGSVWLDDVVIEKIIE